ncbi:MAG: cysteine-rich CWC family protein [Polaromonas sp.]|nr:cysteine-rich CWC family protein [Polaromonas sp.]
MVGNDAECWCVKLPHVMPVPTDNSATGGDAAKASCFCPACLQQITDDQQHTTSPAGD